MDVKQACSCSQKLSPVYCTCHDFFHHGKPPHTWGFWVASFQLGAAGTTESWCCQEGLPTGERQPFPREDLSTSRLHCAPSGAGEAVGWARIVFHSFTSAQPWHKMCLTTWTHISQRWAFRKDGPSCVILPCDIILLKHSILKVSPYPLVHTSHLGRLCVQNSLASHGTSISDPSQGNPIPLGRCHSRSATLLRQSHRGSFCYGIPWIQQAGSRANQGGDPGMRTSVPSWPKCGHHRGKRQKTQNSEHSFEEQSWRTDIIQLQSLL